MQQREMKKQNMKEKKGEKKNIYRKKKTCSK